MSKEKTTQTQSNNTVTRELFVGTETSEPLTEQMMDIEEDNEAKKEDASADDGKDE